MSCRWAVLAVALVVGAASAETTPTPAAAETCTLESQRHPGEDCLVCSGWQGDSAKCLKRLSSRGYQRRCRGSGDAVWPEVWCKKAAAESRPTP
jgi:hypothetical protein